MSFISFAVANSDTGIKLTIDNVRYSCKNDSEIYVQLDWTLQNTSNIKICDIDEPWYRITQLVKYDSLHFKNLNKDNFNPYGIGNTRIMLFQNGKCTFPLDIIDAYGEIGDDTTGNEGFCLRHSAKKRGNMGDFFRKRGALNDSCSIQLEYDSRMQKNGEVPLWRGHLYSNKVPFMFWKKFVSKK